MTRAAHSSQHPDRPPVEAVSVEIVIPVHNEERQLEESVLRLHEYLDTSLLSSWRIVIADNASADATHHVARRLADGLPRVRALRLDRKGRGLALKTAWLASDASVLSYMDVDLSTNLESLPPLVVPLLSGHSHLAIGSRLLPSSHIRRRLKREVLSRGYNLLVHAGFHAQFSDAQCGFKAITRLAARDLLPLVQDESWFFDTELLLLAERNGYRIFEVPVDWVEDLDSRVDVPRTIVEDLRGLWRLRCRFWLGEDRAPLETV